MCKSEIKWKLTVGSPLSSHFIPASVLHPDTTPKITSGILIFKLWIYVFIHKQKYSIGLPYQCLLVLLGEKSRRQTRGDYLVRVLMSLFYVERTTHLMESCLPFIHEKLRSKEGEIIGQHLKNDFTSADCVPGMANSGLPVPSWILISGWGTSFLLSWFIPGLSASCSHFLETMGLLSEVPH